MNSAWIGASATPVAAINARVVSRDAGSEESTARTLPSMMKLSNSRGVKARRLDAIARRVAFRAIAGVKKPFMDEPGMPTNWGSRAVSEGKIAKNRTNS